MTGPFRTVEEGFAWFETFANLERTGLFGHRDYKLDRMRELADAAGHPEQSFQSIHIAGSKGKGSTAALTASVLQKMGYATGIYTSPHVHDYRERIALPGGFYDDPILLEAMHKVRNSVEERNKPHDPPTTFELLTLCAFFTFQAAGCTWAVVETGLGGRLDSTNILLPRACLLTPVELEHTDVLGHTLEEIAREKAGIIKPGVPVFSGFQRPEAEGVFRRRAAEMEAPYHSLPEELVQLETDTRITGTTLAARWLSGKTLDCTLSFAGRHQGENACLAALCIDTLSDSGHIGPVTEQTMAAGLARATLPGRFEIVETEPPFILDTAHTPASAERAVRTLGEINRLRGILIFGAVSGKDVAGMAAVLAPAFSHIIISRPGVFKKNNPRELAEIFRTRHPEVILEEDPRAALDKARALSAGRLPILVTGSFYMAAEIRSIL